MPVPACADELRKLYDAIMALASGKMTASISFGERTVSYSQQQLGDLRAIYGIFHRQCGEAAGLPDLSPAANTERGGPARFRMI